MSYMYQISYDLKDSENTDNDWALKELIQELKNDAAAFGFVRPVATTLRFQSESARFVIYDSVKKWAKRVGVYWMVSWIPESNAKGMYCFQDSADDSLQKRIDKIITEITEEAEQNKGA